MAVASPRRALVRPPGKTYPRALTRQEPANAYEESRRGAYNPTYLYYTLGKLEIQKLRDEYMQKKGGTLQQFHDAFVAQGGLPIPLVRKILFR